MTAAVRIRRGGWASWSCVALVAVSGAVSAAPPAVVPALDGTLAAQRLIVPVKGIARTTLRDTYLEARGHGPHEALDIHAPRGTPVLATGDGRIVRLFRSVPGGLTVYQFDPESRFAYYYAHLDRYAEGLREGQHVAQGDVIGHVGSTGNAAADAPHLHFAIFVLGPEKAWWKGTPLNPLPYLRDPDPR